MKTRKPVQKKPSDFDENIDENFNTGFDSEPAADDPADYKSNLLPGGSHPPTLKNNLTWQLRTGTLKSTNWIDGFKQLVALGGTFREEQARLLNRAIRKRFVKGESALEANDLWRSMQGDSPVPPSEGTGPMNPGAAWYLEQQKKSQPAEDSTPKVLNAPWLEQRDALVRSQEQLKPVPPTAEENAAAELKRREDQVQRILAETACIDGDAFKVYRTAHRDMRSICYELPCGKQIYPDGSDFSRDPYLLQHAVLVRVKPAPQAGMVLVEDAVLRWTGKTAVVKPAMPDEEPEAPPSEHLSLCDRQVREASRGMEKWDLPIPAPQADRFSDARHDREYAPITVPIEERPGYGTTIKYRYKN